jgi:hypothetical protein
VRERLVGLGAWAVLAVALALTAASCGSDTSTADRRQALEDYVS